jgi:hypothetical protein
MEGFGPGLSMVLLTTISQKPFVTGHRNSRPSVVWATTSAALLSKQ